MTILLCLSFMLRLALITALLGGQSIKSQPLRGSLVTLENPAHWALFDDVHVTVTDIGSVVEWTYSPPINRDFEIVLIHIAYSTAAGVGDRYFRVWIALNGDFITLGFTINPVTAGSTARITFGQGLPHASIPGINYITAPLPERFRIPPNTVIRVRVENIQANDVFGICSVHLNMQVKTNL